jgi:FAD binding domain/Berberine and berberine like
MRSEPHRAPPSTRERIDRRAFLAGAGSAAIGVAACGGSSIVTRTKRVVTPTGTTPTTTPLAPRVPNTLQEAIRGQVIERGHAGFAQAAHVYNERFDGVLPRSVARPQDAPDLAQGVQWAIARNVPFRARSGGHSYAGYSTLQDGVVFDLRLLNGIEIAADRSTARIGAGAQLVDVYSRLAAHGVTIPAGSCPSVGIGGHALGGGVGLAGRAFGLATDNIVAIEIVGADGKLGQVNASSDPDLLWALRGGGGGNFGVVSQFEFRLHPVPSSAAWFFVDWPWSVASDALAAWLGWAPHTTDRISPVFHLETASGQPVVSVAGQYLGPSSDLHSLLAPLLGVMPASLSSGDDSYLNLQLRWAGCLGRSLASCHTMGTEAGGTLERASFRAKSDYVSRPLPAAARQQLVDAVQQKQGQPGSGAILFDSYGGAIGRVAPDATAFVHRNELCCIQYLAYDSTQTWLTQTHARMRPYVSGMAYQNYIDPYLTDWRQAYYGSNYPRLVQVQQRVDPEHHFTFPQAIGT